MMNDAKDTALARLLKPLTRTLTEELARGLINIQADEEIQARYDCLAEKRSNGKLSADELTELEAMVHANTLLGILKVEARAFLDQKSAA